ncbi:MAG: hypothetical protein N4A37_11590 [Prolixibacteraceae bacterium]|jgi:hypothetical protein|nr:hypothetical protein [Prolixibacteraceae bacterium]
MRKAKIKLKGYQKNGREIFIGRSQGNEARDDANLEALEKEYDKIVVIIPKGTSSISPSFFLGMFSKSIMSLGGVDNFLKKYEFEFSDDDHDVKEFLKLNIESSLLRARTAWIKRT